MLKITDEAKALLTELLAENNCDCLLVGLQQSCCGTSLDLSLTSKEPTDRPTVINGISVIMDESVKARSKDITLSVENGELVILGDPSSGCC